MDEEDFEIGPNKQDLRNKRKAGKTRNNLKETKIREDKIVKRAQQSQIQDISDKEDDANDIKKPTKTQIKKKKNEVQSEKLSKKEKKALEENDK